MKNNTKKVSLVLASGGARGYAHIVVIEELLVHDHEFNRAYEMIELGGMIVREHLEERVWGNR